MTLSQRTSDGAKLLLGVWMGGVVIAMFAIVPEYVGLGDAGRIIIMHVPAAWITTITFVISAIASIRYLWRRRPTDDAVAVAAAEVGFLFCTLATVTGAIFAQLVWGVFWNWDPRQTSILILLLIYAAYFALRSAIDDVERRRRLAAAYNLFAAVTMPFLLFVVPRVADSTLHPTCAFVQGSRCAGVTLERDGARIKQLGDVIVALESLERQGSLAVARVEVRTPGLADVVVLAPSYDLDANAPADRPTFPGQQFMLAVKGVDLTRNTVLVNIEAPGTGLLSNQRTLWTFMAANLAFLGLAVWLYRLRADLILIEERMHLRGAAHELPA
jgi:heme exporter protein C